LRCHAIFFCGGVDVDLDVDDDDDDDDDDDEIRRTS